MNNFDKPTNLNIAPIAVRELSEIVYDIHYKANDPNITDTDIAHLLKLLMGHKDFKTLLIGAINHLKKISFYCEDNAKSLIMNKFIRHFDTKYPSDVNGVAAKIAPVRGADMCLSLEEVEERELRAPKEDVRSAEDILFGDIPKDEKSLDTTYNYFEDYNKTPDNDPLKEGLDENGVYIEGYFGEDPNASKSLNLGSDISYIDDTDNVSTDDRTMTEDMAASAFEDTNVLASPNYDVELSDDAQNVEIEDTHEEEPVKISSNMPLESEADEEEVLEDDKDTKPRKTAINSLIRDIDTSSVNVDKINVDDFEELFKSIKKTPDAKMLTEFKGTKIEKIKAYRDAHRFGRKLFLPDGGYDVYVKKTRDVETVNYVFSMLSSYDMIDSDVDMLRKEELIRILYENIEFYFDKEPTYNDFTACLSERDLTLLAIMFAIVNLPEHEETGSPTLYIDRVYCSDCKNMQLLKHELAYDLVAEFKKIYPTDLFIKRYKDYSINRPDTIKKAFIKDGFYGELIKLTDSDGIYNYTVAMSRPTIRKSHAVLSSAEELVYSGVQANIIKRIDVVENTINKDTLLSIITDTTWGDFKIESLKYRSLDRDDIEDDSEKVMYDAYMFVLNAVADALSKYEPVLEILNFIEVIKLEPVDTKVNLTTVATHANIQELYDSTALLSEKILTKMAECATKLSDLDAPSNISLTANEIKDYLDFEKRFLTDDEAILRYKDRLRSDITDDEIEAFLKSRNEIKHDVENGICPHCKSKKWFVPYDKILFFSIANRLKKSQN